MGKLGGILPNKRCFVDIQVALHLRHSSQISNSKNSPLSSFSKCEHCIHKISKIISVKTHLSIIEKHMTVSMTPATFWPERCERIRVPTTASWHPMQASTTTVLRVGFASVETRCGEHDIPQTTMDNVRRIQGNSNSNMCTSHAIPRQYNQI